MSKRPALWCAIFFSAGIMIGCSSFLFLIPALVLFLVLGIYVYRKAKRRRQTIAMTVIFALFLMAGVVKVSTENEFREQSMEGLVDGVSSQAIGTIYRKEEKNAIIYYYLKQSKVESNGEFHPCNHILIYEKQNTFQIGQTVRVSGSISLFDVPRNEGEFDSRSFYQSQKVDFGIWSDSMEVTNDPKWKLGQSLYEMREKLNKSYELYCSPSDAGVFSTMVLGNRSLLDAEIKKDYQVGGISHILAISGLHISLIGMCVYRLIRKTGCSFFASLGIAVSIIYLYGMMTGGAVSVIRAVLMFLLCLAAPALKRSYDSVSALSFAALVLLAENPYLLFYTGFQYSFLAVLGVVVVGKGYMGLVTKKAEWKSTMIVSLSIQLVTLPITLWNYYEFPLYAVCVNLAVLPLVAIVLASGILGAIAGLFFAPLARICLFPGHLILTFYDFLCKSSVMLPYGMLVTGKPSAVWMICYYACLIVVLLCLKKYHMKKKRESNVESLNVKQRKDTKTRKKLKQSRKATYMKKTIFFIVPWIAFGCVCMIAGRHGAEVTFLDVGQGDGIFIETPSGKEILIDGGSTSKSQVGTYVMMPFLKSRGCKKLDYVILSHLDEDHYSGVTELIEADFQIGCVFLSGGVDGAKSGEDEPTKALTTLLEEKNIPWYFMWEKDVIYDNSFKMKCLYPFQNTKETDRNAASLVVRYETGGISFLFTGDISTEEEKILCDKKKIEPVTIYKCAHHGSKNANSKEILSVLMPTVSVVSCGENNRYGHPHAETIERLEEVGSTTLRTDQMGEIKVTFDETGKIDCML